MMRSLSIAGNTVREALRERLLYNLVIFALALTVASITISRLTVGEQFRIIADISTTSTQVFGILISVFLGVALVSRELERRTCYAVLARPLSRTEFLLGKFLGLLATVALNLVVMTFVAALVLGSYSGGLQFLGSGFFAAFGLMLAQFAMCTALAVMFASFTTATLATIFALSFVVAGLMFAEVRPFWLMSETVQMKQVVRVLDFLLPNMGLLDAKPALTYGDPISLGSIAARLAYALGYSAVILAVGAAAFSRRDIR